MVPFVYELVHGCANLTDSDNVFQRFDIFVSPQCDPAYDSSKGAQWLSGRVLDSRPKGRGFEPHRRHCVVVLEQDTFILA